AAYCIALCARPSPRPKAYMRSKRQGNVIEGVSENVHGVVPHVIATVACFGASQCNMTERRPERTNLASIVWRKIRRSAAQSPQRVPSNQCETKAIQPLIHGCIAFNGS